MTGTVWAVCGGLHFERPTVAPTSVPIGTATVTRTTLFAREQVAGRLGFGTDLTVRAQVGGVLTALPMPGTRVARGGALYEVDGQPVRLLYGDRPPWRAFVSGMADGPDVRALEENLVALGYGAGVTVDGHFVAATATGVRRWQRALHEPETGTVALGRVDFEPGEVRVGAVTAGRGAVVGPGDVLFTASDPVPAVHVGLDPALQDKVHVGDPVEVTLPGDRPATGTVTEVARSVTAGTSGDPPTPPTIGVVVRLGRPADAGSLDEAPVRVAIVSQRRANVLAVPVTALTAGGPGTYEVELAGGRRVPVTIGLVDETAGLVEVRGNGLAEGDRVVVPL